MLVGLLDEASALYGNPDVSYPVFKKLRVQVIRMDLYWGGTQFAVAKRKPLHPADPADPAYDWSLYDRAANYASQYGVKLMFTFWGTPRWANGGKKPQYPPTKMSDLQNFARAAAEHFSGTELAADGRTIPAIRLWTAWNEPNQPFQLAPQYTKVGKKWVMTSAVNYAKMCTAVDLGVHSTLLANEKVGCGLTAPLGNDNPDGKRPVPTPISFMKAVKSAGLKAKNFDAWAHNPYASSPKDTPTTKPNGKGSVTLGNLDVLIAQVTSQWGPKRIWLTEYGYQTNPPDKTFGVSYTKQAQYLTQAFAIARQKPRVDVMLWFLLRDEPKVAGWQSGLTTFGGKQKPAFNAFMRLPH